MKSAMNRRQFVHRVGAAAAGATLGVARGAAAPPPATLLDVKVISDQPELFHGWPTVARRANGELLLAYSGGREAHVCPFGRVELMRSRDGGESWTWPQVLIDSPIDDRDAGVLETRRGTLLVTTFTSLDYKPILARAENIPLGETGAWTEARLRRWRAAHHRADAGGRRAAITMRECVVRSEDNGVTWSERYSSLVNSPHGPIELADGRLLYAGKELRPGRDRVGVCQSRDDGRTWEWLAEIPAREGDDPDMYHELHAVETADGRLVCQIRNHNEANQRETLQCESSDGGESWSEPRAIGVWGLPSHLLRLRDDRLLMSYGYRRDPRGNRARVSVDHGRSWSESIVLSDDGVDDLGYPSTVELDDGTLLTVWYERLADSPRAVLRQARWRLG
jgi:sialidase-1